MDLSVQSAASAPLNVQEGTRRESLSCRSASQLGMLVRRSQMRGVHCKVVEEGAEAANKSSSTKDRASASWLDPDPAADPFLGWTSDNSQLHQGARAGFIKIGGALVLGIGFALGAWMLHARREVAQTTAALVTVTEETLSSKASKLPEVQDNLEPNDVEMDTHNSEQERELPTDDTIPYVKQEVITSERMPLPASVDHMQEECVAEATGRILVPASVDHAQEQFVAALQALKVIESGVQPGDICTRREYARWLIAASTRLSRSPAHKVLPAMYIENVSRLAYEDVLPEDVDFSFIQGLAEAGMIYSRLIEDDTEEADDGIAVFSPDSPLNRQDLIMWKKALERQPALSASDSSLVSEKELEELSGFIDIKKIHKDARPGLLADIKAGEQSVVALAFGYTRRFQPLQLVTKGQAAAALATGEAWELVSEELARLEAEAIAEAAVAAELALETKAQQEVAAAFNELLQGEREKQQETANVVEKLQAELEQLKMEREEEKYGLLKDRAALDAERDSLASMRREVEQQASLVSSAKVEVSFQKEQVRKLQAEAETEKASISKIRTKLEVEKNALSSARVWAEEEARRALAHSEVLEQARKRWEYQGVEVRVHKELDEVNIPGPSWQYSHGYHSPSSPLGALVTKSNDLMLTVKDAILGFFHSLQLICLSIKQQLLELTENLLPAVKDSTFRFLHAVLTRSKDLARVVGDAISRFFHSMWCIYQVIRQQFMEFVKSRVPIVKGSIDRFLHFVVSKSKDLVRVVEAGVLRFLDLVWRLCRAITQRSIVLVEDLVRVVKDGIVRCLHFVILVCEVIKQQSTKLSGEVGEKFHAARTKYGGSAGNTIAGIKRALPSSVTGMTASFKEGTAKAVVECKGGAERLVQKLKVS